MENPIDDKSRFLETVAKIEGKIKANSGLNPEEQLLYLTHLVRIKSSRKEQGYTDE